MIERANELQRDRPLNCLPDEFNWVQIRRVRRQVDQFDVERLGRILNALGSVAAEIVKHHNDGRIFGIRFSNLLEECLDRFLGRVRQEIADAATHKGVEANGIGLVTRRNS